MRAATDTELAWAAGLFEGEGTIGFNKRAAYPSLSLAMTDADVVDRFHEIVNVGTRGHKRFTRPEQSHYQTQYVWHAGSIDDIRHVVKILLLWLGSRRRKRLLDVLDAYNTADIPRKHKTMCPQGHAYTPENTMLSGGTRYCKTCNRDKATRRRAALA